MNAENKPAKTVSIGFHRDDGDFQLLATLNNNDDLLSDIDFDELVVSIISRLKLRPHIEEEIVALHRQDAPDYVDLETWARGRRATPACQYGGPGTLFPRHD